MARTWTSATLDGNNYNGCNLDIGYFGRKCDDEGAPIVKHVFDLTVAPTLVSHSLSKSDREERKRHPLGLDLVICNEDKPMANMWG
jgi:hypothetical protein